MYIDLSKYNVVTNWQEVAKNVEGVILRVGYRGYGSGKIILDPMFETYARACYNYKVPFGIYFMSQAINPMEAIEEADFAINYAEKYGATLPIFIDSEDGDGTARVVRADGLSKQARTEVCEYFCKTVVNCRRKGGIYASKSWFEDKLDVAKLDHHLLWVAQYGPKCTAKHRVDMWQYTSKGSVPGIKGNVDCSTLYGFPTDPYPTQRTLKKGSIGADVAALQVILNNKFDGNLVVDGKFGNKTENAVKYVQQINNLKVDGIVGEKTRAVL